MSNLRNYLDMPKQLEESVFGVIGFPSTFMFSLGLSFGNGRSL